VIRKLIGMLGGALGRTPIANWPVRVRAGLAKGARWTLLPYSAYWRGTYEPDVDHAVQQLGDLTGAACWDLGTHYGIYTVGLARAVGPTGQVAAFEPDPVSFARCHRHVIMNGLSWVRMFPVAVSEESGQAELFKYSDFGTPITHLPYEGEKGVGATRVPVRTVALDALVQSGEIRLPRFVKIDIEGHGAKAVRGAVESIREARPWIVMAFHSPEEYEGTRECLETLGYSLFDPSSGRRFGWPARYGTTGRDTFLLRCE
jgi:FkbM family methyltransferase